MNTRRTKRKPSIVANPTVYSALPEDVLKESYSNLSLFDLVELATIDHVHYRLLKDNFIWERKMQQHFPEAYQEIILATGGIGINWHAVFIETYQKEYEGLDSAIKRFFTLAKENNPALVDPFAENPDDAEAMQVDGGPEVGVSYDQLKAADLFSEDESGVILLDWILRSCSREIIKSVFDLVETERTQKNLTDTDLDDSGWTLLHWAAALGQAERFDDWFDDEEDLESKTKAGLTPLTWAARYGHGELCLRLLAYGVDINAGCALYYAAQFGKFETCELLLKEGANVNVEYSGGYTSLYIASSKGHHRIVALMLQHQAEVNKVVPDTSTPLYVAAQNGWDKVVELLAAHPGVNLECLFQNRFSPLYIACQKGHTNIFWILLARGANLNPPSGDTPLRATIQNKHRDLMRILLAQGADPNIAYFGSTPLHLLCLKQRFDTDFLAAAKMLIQAGANVFAQHNGTLPTQQIVRYYGIDENALINNFNDLIDDDFVITSKGKNFPISEVIKLVKSSIKWLQTNLDLSEEVVTYSYMMKTRQKKGLETLLQALTNALADIEYKIIIYAFLLSDNDKNTVLKHEIATTLGYASVSLAKWMLQIDVTDSFNVQSNDDLKAFLNQFLISPISYALKEPGVDSNSGTNCGYISAMVWLAFLGTKEQKIPVLDMKLDDVSEDEPSPKRARLASA